MENTGYPCPGCGAPADLVRGCSGCGRPPYLPAAEVIRLDAEIRALGREVERVREAYQGLADRLLAAQRRRAELAARVRAEVARPVPAGPLPPVPPVAVRPVPVPPPGRPETSTRTVQGLLFVLGGLLLGTAAVVFTAVAWAAVGVAGRAAILAAVTVLALAAPLVAVRRGLRGTAETFAAVGLLLVVLDGYAAWAVDLFGVADWPDTRYAALVGGAGAAIAAGYARLSRLTVPWFAALLVVQPVLPLAAVVARPGAAGWALVLLGVALLDLVVVVALRRRSPAPAGPGPVPSPAAAPAPPGAVAAGAADQGAATIQPASAGAGGVPTVAGGGTPAAGPGARIGGPAAGGGPVAGPRVPAVVRAGQVLAWLGFGAATTLAAGCALVPLAWGRAAGRPLLAGAPLLLVGLVLLGAAWAAGGRVFRQVAAALLVPLLAAALLRPVAELRPGVLLVAAALVTAALAGAARVVPAWLRSGPRIGALFVAGALAQVGVLATLLVAGGAVARSLPGWRGAAAGPAVGWGWQLPVAVALTAAAIGLLLPRAARPVTALVGVALTASALPAVAATPWPAALAVDLVVGVALLLAVVRPARRTPTVVVGSLAGAALLGHGLLVALAAPGGMLVTLGVLLPAGLAVAALARRGTPAQRAVAGDGLAGALLAVPAGTVVALLAAGSAPWWQLRAGFAAAVVPLVALGAVRRHWPDLDGYASAAAAVALGVLGLAPVVVPAAEPVPLYAALAALLLVVVDRDTPASAVGRVVAAALAVVAALAAAPVAVTALLSPYDGPVEPWSGVPATGPLPGGWAGGAALLVLAVAAGLVGRRTGGGAAVPALLALPFAAAALPVLLAAAGVPWPVLPAVALLTGLAALLAAALRRPGPLLGAVAVPVGTLWTLAGLAGLFATRAGTLAGLALLVVAAAVAGVAGRRAEVRLAGCLVAVAAATGLAVTASLAVGLPLRTAGFAVLAVAVAVLYAAPPLARRTPVTGRAAEGAAQAVALVGLLLTTSAPRHAAAVCVLWGAAVAPRVLRRGESADRRWAFAGIAGGSELLGAWLLLAAGGVVLLEAYTLPAAGLALVAGVVAVRTRPGLTSWLALGPGLAAGLLPGLVSVLVAPEPQPCDGCCSGSPRWPWCSPGRPGAGRRRWCSGGPRWPCWPCTSWSAAGICCPGGSTWPSAGSP
ncbi:hypothetical protein [Micromonospora sp. DPT]|uniref:hypothetical protein n=1 Tax=Micromonospora sp. DPT TaxID=3142975 RepID=UPI0032088EB7